MEHLLPALSHIDHVHPLFVHFPIALWPVALLLWGFSLVRKNERSWEVGTWIVIGATVAAASAVATGLWASSEMGHDSPGHDLVHLHRNFMLVASSLSLVVAIAAVVLRNNDRPAVRWGLVGVLVVVNGVAVFGGDHGAALVYRYGMNVAFETPPGGGHTHDGEHDDHHGDDDDHPVDEAQPSPDEEEPEREDTGPDVRGENETLLDSGVSVPDSSGATADGGEADVNVIARDASSTTAPRVPKKKHDHKKHKH